MTTDRHPAGLAIDAERRRKRRVFTPVWVLRYRLRWVRAAILRIKRQLDDEFASLDTEPMLAELESLILEQSSLIQQLQERLR